MPGISKTALGIPFRRGGGINWDAYWVNQPEVLFLGLYSEISGGQMPNKVTGATDYLTVTGSVGSETFQTPNTAPYIDSDTDYIWFTTDTGIRTTTTAELVGYDFTRTIVKYQNDAPYAIEAIMILSSDVDTVKMRDDFDLSIWWDGILSIYGNLKGNRGPGQSVWTPESVDVTGLTVTPVSNTALTLNWSCATSFIDGYKIEQSTNGIDYAQIDTTTDKTYPVTGLTGETQYWYRVRTYKDADNGEYCDPADAWTAHLFLLTSTGTGDVTAELRFKFAEETIITVDGTGMFYTDAAGTENPSTTWTIPANISSLMYVKVQSGTSNMLIFDSDKMVRWGWTGNVGFKGAGAFTNAPSCTATITKGSLLSELFLPYTTLATIDLTNLPTIKVLNLQGVVGATGTWSPTQNISYIYCSNANTIVIDFGLVTLTSCTYLKMLYGSIVDYTPGATWGNATITITPSVGFGLSSTEVNNMLIDMAASPTLIGKTIDLRGSNAARTAASDAAVATLEGVGRTNTVYTN